MSQKKVDRTRELEWVAEQQWLLEIAQNDIEEHNFKNLILLGIIVLQVNISNSGEVK